MEQNKTESNEYTPKQNLRKFVEVLLSQDVMGNKEKAMRVSGVNKGIFFYHLKKDVRFKAWFKQQCEDVFTMHLPSTIYSVQKQSVLGETKASLAILEMAGIYKPKENKLDLKVDVGLTPQFNFTFQSQRLDKDKEDGDTDSTGSDRVHAGKSPSRN